jgi:hypothetical protein
MCNTFKVVANSGDLGLQSRYPKRIAKFLLYNRTEGYSPGLMALVRGEKFFFFSVFHAENGGYS